jgi:hypothetical protein
MTSPCLPFRSFDLTLTLSLKEREFPFSFKEKGPGDEVTQGEGARG